VRHLPEVDRIRPGRAGGLHEALIGHEHQTHWSRTPTPDALVTNTNNSSLVTNTNNPSLVTNNRRIGHEHQQPLIGHEHQTPALVLLILMVQRDVHYLARVGVHVVGNPVVLLHSDHARYDDFADGSDLVTLSMGDW
jgi:hypothetical protein